MKLGSPRTDDHTIEFLLAFDGRIHHLDGGYWMKFEIRRIAPTSERPHGLRYSFTLHDKFGRRVIGFDNAHAVKPGRHSSPSREHDHWHRTSDDPGRPYAFTTADKLVDDFFTECERYLSERGLSTIVIDEGEMGARKP
ncbi:hypothetical protein GCM10011322_09690 [Salinarimonas ramus]|uniref:Uncharacterized protein n=2 Tax=Salinarimonas ramus TaxID=690164 RepID=A0A917Q5C2_9HYPH|nr:hypothetical protein GCM10011322_09690 [Salinarimonas ramus]